MEELARKIEKLEKELKAASKITVPNSIGSLP